MTRISSLATLASTDPTDLIPVVDISATATKKSTKADFLSDVYDGSNMGIGAIKANKADFSVANAAARTALASPFEGLICYQKDIDATFIYDGSTWRQDAQFEELGRTVLGTAGDTISVTPIAARNFLRCFYHVVSTGGSIGVSIRFNNDSATNYAFTYSSSFGAAVNQVSNAQLTLSTGFTVIAGTQMGYFDITNFTSQRKLVMGRSADDNNASAASSCNSLDINGKWDNTAAQITRIDIINAGTGDYAIGSKLIVVGKD